MGGRGWAAGKIFVTILLHFYSLEFDMQHEHVLQKLNLTF